MSGKAKIIVIAVLSVIILAGTAVAQAPGGWGSPAGGPQAGAHEMGPGGPGQHSGFGMENLARFRMMFRHLDLTEEQANEIESITEIAREDVMEIVEEARSQADRTHFMDVFTSPTLTVSDLENTMGQMHEVMEVVQYVIFEAIVDVHDVLTIEQLEKLAEMAEEHAGGMDHGSGMGHPGR
ncbi:MAG: Spy/CpxP family protein refolding chaperone [Candidatus Aegiribacteria sp.]|nr:Spy/CpxP family protein refolding chaperone [Candidatus Aegiribacteria sp.]